MREWRAVANKLHSRQNVNKESNATKAWHHRNGVMLSVAKRGAIELPASLMDELFAHMRCLNDLKRFVTLPRHESSSFYTKDIMRKYKFCCAETSVISQLYTLHARL